MQERIGGPFDPLKPDLQKARKAAEAKTNPVLFDQIKSWVNANARAELLMKALGFLELATDQQMLEKQKEREKLQEMLLPQQDVAKKAAEKASSAKQILPTLQEFEKALVRGDAKQAAAWLMETHQGLNDPKKPLPPGTQKNLQETYRPLFQSKSPSGKTLNDLLFQADLGRAVVASQGNWGSTTATMTLGSMMQKLKEMAGASPPTAQSEMAQNLLGDLQGEDGEELFRQLLQNPAQNPVAAEIITAGQRQSLTDVQTFAKAMNTLLEQLKQLSNVFPATANSVAAKKLLEQIQKEGGSALKAFLASPTKNAALGKQLLDALDPTVRKLLENPQLASDSTAAEIVKLLQSAGSDRDVKRAAADAAKNLATIAGPKGLYEAYLQEIEGQAQAGATLEGMKKNLATQKEFFLNAIAVLKKHAPGNPAVAKMLSQLIAIKFPPESESDAGSINDFSEEFFNTYTSLVQQKAIAPEGQREFLDQIKNYCDTSIKNNEETSDGSVSTATNLRTELATVQSVTPSLDAIVKALTSLESGEKLQPTEFASFTSALLDLHSHYGDLDPHVQHQIDALTTELQALSPDSDSLAKATSGNYIYSQLSDFSTQKAGDFQTYLTDQVEGLKAKTSSPFLSAVTSHIDSEMGVEGFPANSSLFQTPYASEGTLAPNTEFLAATTRQTDLTATSPQKALYQTAVLDDTIDEKSDTLNSQIAGTNSGGKLLESQNNNFYSSRADAENKKLMTPPWIKTDPPLPWQFAQVIFDKVIPNQDNQLIAAGELLSMYNDFSSGCNDVLTDLTGWDSASYNEAGWLNGNLIPGSNPPAYNLTPQQVESEMQTAGNNLVADFQRLQAAVKDLQDQINAIKNGPQPLNTAQQNRLNELNTDMSNLIGPGTDPNSVINFNIPSPPPTPIGYNCFPAGGGTLGNMNGEANVITSCWHEARWEDVDGVKQFFDGGKYNTGIPIATQFSTAEGNLVNGAAGATSSGMKNIYAAISAEQSNYSGYSQQQQMQLQLTMTETQQMFSTITSAMQDLNQSYMSVAQAISK